MNLLTKLAQKPTDKMIRLIRIGFSLLLFLVIYFGWKVTEVNFSLPEEIKYGLYSFPAIGLIRWIFDPGIVRKGIWKWIIVGCGIIMLLGSLFFLDDIEISNQANVTTLSTSWELSIEGITQTKEGHPFTLSTDNWFWFFSIILIIVGFFLNNKNITSKNERFGEKIKKIRV